MSIRWYYADAASVTQEMTSQIDILQKVSLSSHAEQGQTDASAVKIDDPTATFDINGHRPVWAEESAAPANNKRIYHGFVNTREYVRDMPPGFVMSETRNITINLDDPNTLLTRRIMQHDDANRSAETDVERITWVLSTTMAESIEDVTTYVSSAHAVAMDAADYRGQTLDAVIRDCADQSGKNFWVSIIPDGAGHYYLTFWYDKASSTAYSSSATISNDKADINNTTCFSASEDTKLVRDPSRLYASVWGNYDGGHVFRTLTPTVTAFANRDTTANWPNVKTEAKATARADRYLLEIASEEDVITTTIRVTAAHVNDIREGMRVQAKFTHTDYTTFTWMRVLDRVLVQVPPYDYDITLTLSPPSAAHAASCSVAGAGLSLGAGDSGVITGDTSAWASVPSPSVYPSVVLVGAFYVNGGTDIGGPPVTVDSPFTLSDSYSSAGYDHSISDVAYHALTSGAPGSFFTHWSGGGGASAWEALSIALPTAETAPVQTAPVQSGGISTFPSALTVGNIVLMCQVTETSGVPALPTGWTQISLANFSAPFTIGTQGIAWYYQCVTEATTIIGTGNPSFTHFSFVTEWALT